MSSEMKSASALTSLILTESNWLLWRREAIIGLELLDAYMITAGDEPCPQNPMASLGLPHPAQSSPIHSSPTTDHSRLTTLLQNAVQAHLNLQAEPDNNDHQSRSESIESELLQLLTSRPNVQIQDNIQTENRLPSSIFDWKHRHSKAYHLLLGSISEHFKTMTIDCPDLPSTWT